MFICIIMVLYPYKNVWTRQVLRFYNALLVFIGLWCLIYFDTSLCLVLAMALLASCLTWIHGCLVPIFYMIISCWGLVVYLFMVSHYEFMVKLSRLNVLSCQVFLDTSTLKECTYQWHSHLETISLFISFPCSFMRREKFNKTLVIYPSWMF